ncbi:MAG: histidine phosphatase family protein, partial [Pseudomonadota bacterium]
ATGVDAPTERQMFLEHFPRIFESWENGALEQGTESFADFQARVTAAIEDALMPDRTTLIVTSGGVIGITLQRVLGLSAGKAADLLLNIHNASVHRLTLEHGVVRLALFNGSPHLEQEDRRHARTFI